MSGDERPQEPEKKRSKRERQIQRFMKKECLSYEQAEQKLREIKLERRIKRVMRKGVDRDVAQIRLQELRVEKASARKERKERIRSAKQAYLQQKNEERIRRYAESKGLSYEAAKVALVALESSIAKAAKSEQRRQRILSDRTHLKDDITFVHGDKVITQIVSGGGGPGTGKKLK